MRDLIITLAIVGACGSIGYYYLVLLPENQQDIKAIRSVVAPTPEQQAVQRQQQEKALQDMNAAFDKYLQCERDMQKKREAYLSAQCPQNPNSYDFMKVMDCRSKAISSSGFRQFDCKTPY